ncbi:MAG TPA: DUF6493 family protein [Trebonia sp.]|nr:DUF6493 family protein [Trebonia sp.]
MSVPGAAAVEAAVWAEDAPAVRELLADATETDRRALAKALKPLLTGPKWERPASVVFTSLDDGVAFIRSQMAAQLRGDEPEPSPGEREQRDWWNLSRTPAFAAFAVGVTGGRVAALRVLEECQGHNWDVSAAEWAVIAGVLADRNPPWLTELAEAVLSSDRIGFTRGPWWFTRSLVRLAAMGHPSSPEYAVSMAGGLAQDPPLSGPMPSRTNRVVPELIGSGGDLLARAILDDRGLLEHEIWRLFTDPGVGKAMEGSLWGPLRLGDQWSDALAELSEAGQLDRARLLDECLDAFLRDFPPNHVAWYASLHDRLEPSADEAAERSPRYLALLAARSKQGVSLGQRMCGAVLDAKSPGDGEGPLAPEAFLAASAPALMFPTKSVATAQLKLVGKLADTSVRDMALATVAQAFAHQREDVQAAALKLIARHGMPDDTTARAAVVELAEALSPVLRPDAEALGLLPAAQSAADPAALAAEQAGHGPEDAPAPQVLPLTEAAELVPLLAQLMEDASDTLAVERAMAGAVRLAGLPLATRTELARPLLKRAHQQVCDVFLGPFSGYSIRADMAWLTLTWATGELPPATMGFNRFGLDEYDAPWQSREPRTLSGILSARIGEACTLIAEGRALPPLAEPEFTDGTISPGALAERQALWAAAGVPPRPYDLVVARLREGPGTEDGLTLEVFVRLPGVRARYLLPQEQQERSSDDDSRVRARLAHVPARAAAALCWPLLTGLEHPRDGRAYSVFHGPFRLDEMIAAWPLTCPHHPELIAAHLLSPLSDGIEHGRNAAVTALRGLAGLTGEFGNICHLALATGLSAASAEVRIAAADAWARLAVQGRLNPSLAAESIELGVTGGVLKLSRIADGLGHAAVDPATAPGVAQTCLLAAATLLPAKPAGLHLLLELAAKAGAASAMPEVPAPVAELARGKENTKLAEAARRLTRLAHR